ncbi:molybdopterin molybdotransferase MoeA [Haloferax mediterranei ATCC 33500]|uniref:Molybdenum cofactor biosynthesis protein MoaA n=1 Tax=Haloferax mediterranei (strain ATCC 33500 / DSM 1411 / JCM 8866 / NBRC 14739 / NCIMB 2177 / R-4) TaxID=523841 RepID=I3R6Z1_HALMT|nr:gephyrin-like molybdotransferase Glp [Haloferax mediterranei]AFK20001.1 molybdopterin biosynthesis protein moeA [Haloferax mediterranei ATCC 33500]AHZ23380.1 molybdenum cofactor biosynthesis protein MoaA [Haloferax mediterranei ATCC 33500]ELZ99548.1 molybdenum cofactor synthesis protein [Haloferax mediterranei ATCC 33500]MDX5987246.1 molybdopterin molybdotransferase MoeA [Haloferax mediterranei ATCC 33500]QCQ73768.1 molybdopterin molybdotransferase MoeA [Haloferax mediterranei ATCC 33500]
MNHDDRRTAGFKERTRVADARETLLAAVSPHERTERRPLGEADGRALAETAVAPADVPGYDRAAVDGYAVRAADTFGASGRSPSILRVVDGVVEPGTAARVHTGSDLPDGADAVVMVEDTERLGDELEVFSPLAEGKNVGERGEDVREGDALFDVGHELRPSDLGLLRSVGVEDVTVFERPRIAVVPTGEELVESDPEPGQVIETNGLTVSRLVERWGGDATYRDIVVDDADLLREAIESDLDHDVVVTTGGSSVGERDLIPDVVAELGEVLVHGVALKPGHPVALGVVEGTPVVMLPGYPVACLVNAFQFLRPLLKHVGSLPQRPLPTVGATLTRKVPSSPGTRTFARVRLDHSGDEITAEPARTSGSGILSSVALSDGWVVVPEDLEGHDEGETVTVEGWEWSA